jgi:hypothetical protein
LFNSCKDIALAVQNPKVSIIITGTISDQSFSSHHFAGYVLQNTRSVYANFCASISFNPNTSTTHVFIHGLDNVEVQNFKTRVRSLSDLCSIPTLIPALLLEFRESISRKSLDNSEVILRKVEMETGLSPRWWSTSREERLAQKMNRRSLDEMDFERITHYITSASTSMAHVEYRCKSHLPVLDILDQIGKNCLPHMNPCQRKAHETAELRVRSLIDRLKVSAECTLARTKYLSTRADIQRQTVSENCPLLIGFKSLKTVMFRFIV